MSQTKAPVRTEPSPEQEALPAQETTAEPPLDIALYTVRFTREALDEATVDEYIGLIEGNFPILRRVLARNVFDKKTGKNVSAALGDKIIGKMKVRELKDVMRQIKEQIANEVPEE